MVEGGLTALFALFAYDFLQPRILKAVQGISLKRYALVPGVDFCNHRANATADFSFEYFAERFVMRSLKTLEPGEQVFVSYGERDNDKLVQYYGFVENDNPNDVYVFGEEVEMLLKVPKGKLCIGRDGKFTTVTRKELSKSLQGGEKEIEKVLRDLCASELDGFPTTVKEDVELLKKGQMNDRMKLAIQYRLGKKKILASAAGLNQEEWITKCFSDINEL